MPRPQHPEARPEAQEFFKEIVVEQIAAIAERHPDAKVEVWHQDEARSARRARSPGCGRGAGRGPAGCASRGGSRCTC
jgi:hypothetical protein